MNLYLSSRILRSYKRLTKKQPNLITKTKLTLSLLKINPEHPHLKRHKLSGRHKQIWSISVAPNLRITYLQKGQNIILVNIGSHDQVY